jgi:acetylornithine deacetylase/succinyl-diaminopimelate desuccinylase-like protein
MHRKILLLLYIVITAIYISGPAIRGQSSFNPKALTADQKLARDIFRELIEINTTVNYGSTRAAEAMAKRLLTSGFPDSDIQVIGPGQIHQNLVVRYRGTGKHPPILFIGHLDVVEAHRQDWTMDPFQFIEQDGYFYGRGTTDMKCEDADLVSIFIRLKLEGFIPNRDIILALTEDEEGGDYNGVAWLLAGLRQAVADSQITITRLNQPFLSPRSPLRKDVMDAVESQIRLMWPEVIVTPVMSTGATDGKYLRRAGIPVYGISGMFGDPDDIRAHGQDERIAVSEFYSGVEFMYGLMKTLTLDH